MRLNCKSGYDMQLHVKYTPLGSMLEDTGATVSHCHDFFPFGMHFASNAGSSYFHHDALRRNTFAVERNTLH